MEFNLPETKEQMYKILDDLFHHYRINVGQFTDIGFEELNITKMEYVPLSETKLRMLAVQSLGGKHLREKKERKEKFESEINAINREKTEINNNLYKEKENIKDNFAKSGDKLRNQIIKSGLINSTVLVDKLTLLENEQNEQLKDVESKANQRIAMLDGRITSLTNLINGIDEYYNTIHEKEILDEMEKLREKEEEKKKEIFKYNSTVDEREKRYRNQIKQANANLHLKFLDIRSKEMTKDELVELGYYDDVLRCAGGYYDRLPADTAFTELSVEKKLSVYLDDYYQGFIYLYKLKSQK